MFDRNQRAEELGYSSYTCPTHGRFWSDSGDPCPWCEPAEEPESPPAEEE